MKTNFKFRKFWVTPCVVLGLALTACGNNNSNNNGNPAPSAPVGPSSGSWQQIHTEATSEVVTGAGCDNPLRFTVQFGGTYSAGPCHTSQNDMATGHLTQDELNQLNGQIGTVAGENLSGNADCRSAINLGSAFVDLTTSTHGTVRIFSQDTGSNSVCYHGTPGDVDNLSSTLGKLAVKYYPGIPH
jgi:hypothetical protein